MNKQYQEYNHQLLIKDIIQTPLAKNLNQKIIYSDKSVMSYTTFYERVAKLANVLTSMGVKAGDTVAVMDYDSNRYLESYFAVPMIGAILHTINIRLSPEQILYTINHAEDNLILIHNDFIPLLENIKDKIETVTNYIYLSDDESSQYEELLKKASSKYEFLTFDENTIATTFYTTGTTGQPKGVYFSHRQLVLHTLSATASLGTSIGQNFTQSDVYMPLTPMFHVHAWGLPYIATFMGIKQVYPGKYIPDNLLTLIDKHQVTFSHCVPTILNMLFNSPKIDSIDLSNWTLIIGGASMPKELVKTGLDKGIDIFSGYGLSETAPVLSLAQLTPEMLELCEDDQIDIRTQTGRPIGLVDLKIVDESMEEVKSDGISRGEIVVRSPWLTKAYFKDKQNSANLWRGGYLHTGDVAYIKDNGYFKIVDRIKDVIKVGGEWVSSLELEDIIIQHNKVKEVAVISMSDKKWSEIPLALVVSDFNDVQTKKEILSHLKESITKGILSREGLLLKLKFVESIDKTSVGKVNKKLLRELYSMQQ